MSTFATDYCNMMESAFDRMFLNAARADQVAYEAATEPLSPSAIEYAETKVLEDMEYLIEFLQEGEDGRLPCAYFGPISTGDLVGQVLLNKSATDQQLAAAARELRSRLLSHHDKSVMRFATEVVNNG